MAKAGPAPPASDEQTADAWVGGMFMAPFIIAVLPVGGLVWGIRSLAPAKVEKFYVPAGYQRHGADQWIASMTNPCGGEPVRTTALKNGDEFLTVKTDRTLIYARFHHGVTVEYSR